MGQFIKILIIKIFWYPRFNLPVLSEISNSKIRWHIYIPKYIVYLSVLLITCGVVNMMKRPCSNDNSISHHYSRCVVIRFLLTDYSRCIDPIVVCILWKLVGCNCCWILSTDSELQAFRTSPLQINIQCMKIKFENHKSFIATCTVSWSKA